MWTYSKCGSPYLIWTAGWWIRIGVGEKSPTVTQDDQFVVCGEDPDSPAGASRTQPQLRNAGLPDPVEATQLEAWAIQHGVSYDDLKSRFGGSP
jgi:hypothetical protein